MAKKKQLPLRSFRLLDPKYDRRLLRLAAADRRSVAQMARLLVEDAIAGMEEKLGLPPIEEEDSGSESHAA